MIKPERAPFALLYRKSLWQDNAAVADVNGRQPTMSFAEMRQTIWSYGDVPAGDIEDMIDGCDGRLTIEIGNDSDRYDFVIVGEIYHERRIRIELTPVSYGFMAAIEIDRHPVETSIWNNHPLSAWDRAINTAKQMIDKGDE